jgi:3-dehydroquinate synthase
VKHGQIRLILLKSLGEAVLTNDFDATLLTDVLAAQST